MSEEEDFLSQVDDMICGLQRLHKALGEAGLKVESAKLLPPDKVADLNSQLAAAIERAERAEELLREARYDVMIMESDGLLRRIDAALKEQGGGSG